MWHVVVMSRPFRSRPIPTVWHIFRNLHFCDVAQRKLVPAYRRFEVRAIKNISSYTV